MGARKASIGGLVWIAALCTAVLATPWPSAGANPSGPALEHFGAREGLPAESINSLCVDRAGLLWIASREGLYSYDGYSFTGYVHDIADPASLVDNWVRTVFEDRSATLWVGTNTGGLARLDRATGRFETFRHDSTAPETLSHDSVYAIADADGGALWVGTQSGLNRFDPRTGRAQRIRLLPVGNPRSGAEYIFSLLPDEDGSLWVATVGDGVLRFDPRTGAVLSVPVDAGTSAKPGASDAFALAHDRERNLWIGARYGVLVRRRSDGALSHIAAPPGSRMPITGAVVPVIVADPSGPMWVGTFRGVFRVDQPPSPSLWIDGESGELTGKAVTGLALSGDGSLWIGTTGAGLHRLLPSPAPFTTIGANGEGLSSLSHTEVTSILEDPQGQLWVGTFGGGVDRLDRGAKRFAPVPTLVEGRRAADGVLHLATDRTGRLWIGARDGLYRFDPRDGSTTPYRHDPASPSSLGRGYVFAVLVDSDDRVWVGSGGGGLSRLRRDGSGFDHFPLRPGDPTTPSVEFVTVLYEDAQGRLWEGTRSGGINVIDRVSGKAVRIPVNPRDPEAIAHHYVTTILEDSRGRLWVGTGGGGVARLVDFDPAKGARFARITARDGLADDTVMSMVEDDDGSFWIATRRGLTRFDAERNIFVSYDVTDGLPSSEGNLGAAFGGRDALYIGTFSGLVMIPRGTPFPDPPPARIAITAVRTAKGRPAKLGDDQPLSAVEIGHREVLSVEFAVVDFDPHRRHRYAYRVGASAPWVDLGARRDLTFTDLPPGDNVLQVRGRGARGGWSEPPAVLTIRVVPPFYRTAWFRMSSLVALVGGALAWHLTRTARLERRNRELAELHAQREAALRLAQAKEEDLQEAVGRLRQLTRRLEAAREEERKDIARELHDEMGQMLTAAKLNIQLVQRHGAAESSAQRMTDTVELLDRMIKLVRTLSFELRPQLMDELGLVAALRGHLEAQAWRSNLALNFTAEGLSDRLPAELEIAAFRIVQEAVTNVGRHAEASGVDVSLHAEKDRLLIVVQDDGRGFDPAEAAERRRTEAHIGLPGMEERTQALGGEFSIESAPGRGTTVRAALPLRG